jgi:hypothetical protein
MMHVDCNRNIEDRTSCICRVQNRVDLILVAVCVRVRLTSLLSVRDRTQYPQVGRGIMVALGRLESRLESYLEYCAQEDAEAGACRLFVVTYGASTL